MTIYNKIGCETMATVLIKDDLFKSISEIAKRENTTEEELLNEMIEKK